MPLSSETPAACAIGYNECQIGPQQGPLYSERWEDAGSRAGEEEDEEKIPFLATGGPGDYTTFICLSGNVLLHRISAVSPLLLLLLRLSDLIKLPALTNLSYKHE